MPRALRSVLSTGSEAAPGRSFGCKRVVTSLTHILDAAIGTQIDLYSVERLALVSEHVRHRIERLRTMRGAPLASCRSRPPERR